uniref:RAD54 homolog B n=1 Tax=Scleropages formosus TaxID=113540 RepID=A0A8C9W0J3_SCLFO
MRRSGAPSQRYGNVAKRPRFVPPLSIQGAIQGQVLEAAPQPPQGTLSDTLNKIFKTVSSSLSGSRCQLEATPTQSPLALNSCAPALGPTEGDGAVPDARYFSVMWCKASKKKHKRWEGDAVLVAKGRSVLLKDTEGKDIGRGTGYRSSELESLAEGQTLMVGGKEIEVMGIISPEDYRRGRCFQEAQVEVPSGPIRNPLSKPFSRPGVKGVAANPRVPVCHPRHDPLAPGALVMPRPTENHQWTFNQGGLPVVDVVVDPHLTSRLRPHQREGVLFLYECVMGMRATRRHGAILADEMGLGKTLQCITLVWTLLRQGPYGSHPVARRALVVTPGSLVKNWAAEFNKWLGKERIGVFTVDQDHRVEEFLSSPRFTVLVISYEMLLRSVEQVSRVEFGLVVCDEGHRLKNSNIKTSTALSSLACNRRIILTGTPVQNDLQEFYAIIEFVNPGVLGSPSAYRKVYEEPIVRSRQPSATEEEKRLGEERAAELNCLTGLFILRRTQEIINRYLPPKLEWIVFCRPSQLQLEVYRKLLTHRVVRACLQGALENSPHLVCIGALKKLCNHPSLLYATEKGDSIAQDPSESTLYQGLEELFPEGYSAGGFHTAHSGKLLVLCDLLAAVKEFSPSDRVVLVSNYTQTLDLLQDLCGHLGYSFCRLDGQTPVAQRQRLVDRFNNRYSTDFVFLLSSKAGGVGLNLVGASHLILYDIDWNPANDIQAMARVWRDGQRKTVHIYRLLTTGTIEEKIYQRQVSKQGLSGAVVDSSKRAEHSSFPAEELKDLFTLHEGSECVTHDLLGCCCTGDGSAPGWAPVSSSCRTSTQGHLTMSELMQWRHYSSRSTSFSDAYLDRVQSHISFAFRSTASTPQPPPQQQSVSLSTADVSSFAQPS